MTKRYHIEKDSIDGSHHIIDDSIPSAKLRSNEIKIVEEFDMISSSQSVVADAVGTPTFAHSAQILRSETVEKVKAGEALIDYEWATTADGSIEVYDETAGNVLGAITGLVGGETDDDAIVEIDTTLLVAGNRIVVRANVTVAGDTGETATLHRVKLRIVRGYS